MRLRRAFSAYSNAAIFLINFGREDRQRISSFAGEMPTVVGVFSLTAHRSEVTITGILNMAVN